MKKTAVFLFGALFASFNISSATQVAFAAESGSVLVEGSVVDHGNELTWLGFFVPNANFASFTSSLGFGESSSLTSDGLSNVISALDTASGGSYAQFSPTPLAQTPSFGYLNTVADPNNPLDSGSAGNHAVLVVFDGSSLGSLGLGSNIGVVATTSQTSALGTFTVDFSGANLWDQTLVGQSGSLSLATVVPEPSLYSAIAGLLALGFAVARRRRA